MYTLEKNLGESYMVKAFSAHEVSDRLTLLFTFVSKPWNSEAEKAKSTV